MLTSHLVHRKVAFGFVLAFLSILLDSIYDVSIKYLVSSYAVSQLIFLRLSGDIFTSVIVVSIQRKPSLIFARNYPLHILRAMCFAATMFSLYHSLHMLPLALVTILFMLGPIIISLLTPILLRERFRFVHIVIACSGFIGAYIILSPALSKFDVQMLLPVASAFFYAMVSILSRKLGRTDSATSIAVNGSILIMTMLLLFTANEWTQFDSSDIVPLIVLVMSGGVSSYIYIVACHLTPLPLIAPIDYTLVLLAALWGFLFWEEVPSNRFWIGSSFILAAAVGASISAWRFRQ